jgi:hypothetical protein
MTEEKKYKVSGPVVSAHIKRIIGILAQDAGVSVETYLGDLVTEALQPKWEEFQARMAAEWTSQEPQERK